MTEMKLQIQAQLRLADSLGKLRAQEGLTENGTSELNTIQESLAKKRAKLGFLFDDFAKSDLNLVEVEERKTSDKNVKLVTVILYESSL